MTIDQANDLLQQWISDNGNAIPNNVLHAASVLDEHVDDFLNGVIW